MVTSPRFVYIQIQPHVREGRRKAVRYAIHDFVPFIGGL